GFSAHRNGFLVARARPLHHQFAAECRHECGARGYHRGRLDIHRHQPAVRPALSHARPADAAAMTGMASTGRAFLLAQRPQSRLQARLGRAYATWQRFSANRLAIAGLAIIVALLAVAAFADILSPYSPVVGDLRDARLLPPG